MPSKQAFITELQIRKAMAALKRHTCICESYMYIKETGRCADSSEYELVAYSGRIAVYDWIWWNVLLYTLCNIHTDMHIWCMHFTVF